MLLALTMMARLTLHRIDGHGRTEISSSKIQPIKIIFSWSRDRVLSALPLPLYYGYATLLQYESSRDSNQVNSTSRLDLPTARLDCSETQFTLAWPFSLLFLQSPFFFFFFFYFSTPLRFTPPPSSAYRLPSHFQAILFIYSKINRIILHRDKPEIVQYTRLLTLLYT